MAFVLIIDDQNPSSRELGSHLQSLGHRVTFAHTLAEGFQQVSSGSFDVVYLNPRMPDGAGLDWLPRMLAHNSHSEVIILTDSANPDEAEAAIQRGAWDYIERAPNLKSMASRALSCGSSRSGDSGRSGGSTKSAATSASLPRPTRI